MQTIEIQTTQNVNIEYPIASAGERIVAALIDQLILIGYLIAVIFFYIWLINVTEGSSFHFPVAYIVILFLPYFFYHLLCETFLNGQSFAKKMMKMRVVKVDGTQAGIGSYFLRWILAPIDYFFFLGLIILLINGKGQRLGDLAAHTTVVKLKVEAKLDETILTATPTNYTVVFQQANLLSDGDASIIKEVLDLNYKKPNIEIYMNILNKTKEAVQNKMGVHSELHPLTFLDTVLKDYNHLNTN
jgi:uncharacterized RDD family membrane protein YckC